MAETTRSLLIVLLIVSLIVITNYETDNSILNSLKSISTISAIMFIPGYFLASLALNRPLEIVEALVLGIGLSVLIVVFGGVLIVLAGMTVSASNISNITLIITCVLVVIGLSKPDFKWFNIKREKSGDRLLYLNIFLMVFVVGILIFVSMVYPPTEEFVELKWKMWKIEDLASVANPDCGFDECTRSGFNKVSNIEIDGETYSVLFMDFNSPGKYDSICIDLDHSGTYCGPEEGPFWPSDSFFIDDSGFSFRMLTDESILVLNYPKEAGNETFSVSYDIKSHYSSTLDYDIYVSINESVLSTRQITLEPSEEMTMEEHILLPANGTYRVEVFAYPSSVQERASISFLVER